MKRKIIIARRERRKVNSKNYAKKLENQRKGNFSSKSPFSYREGIEGLSLQKFNSLRRGE